MRKLIAQLLVTATMVALLVGAAPAQRASAATPTSSGIVWYNSQTGETQLWYMSGNRLASRATVLGENGSAVYIGPPFQIVGTGDMNGDQSSDILWYNTQTGETQVWYMNGNRLASRATVLGENGAAVYIGPPFKIVGNGDMNADGKADILWYNTQTGETQVWYMNGNRLASRATVLGENGAAIYIGPPFKIVGNGDMNADGKADILWYNTQTGETQVWYMNGNRLASRATVLGENGAAIYIGPPFKIVGNGDMNADGKADILWYNTQTGETQVWYMNGNRLASRATVLGENGAAIYIGPPFQIVGNGKFNPPSAPTGSDDYPYSPRICGHAGNCAGIDPWGFTKQQCVSFVAWRLGQRGVSINGATYGDAKNWDSVAASRGYTVNSTPAVGAVAQWRSGESFGWADAQGGTHFIKAGSAGHVAYVTAVNADGTVNIEEYNQTGDQSYHQQFSIRAPRYIRF